MTLEADLLSAHAASDGRRLAALYRAAADGANDIDAACFYLTHAYVYALEAGDDPAISHIHARLAAEGREPPHR
jgi:hypothetical protein